MPTIKIDSSLCCGDALCVRVCPANCLRMKGDKAALVPLGENLCLACGQCMAVCPRAAIHLGDEAGLPAPMEPAPLPSEEETARLILSRRSVRHFKAEPVPREVLTRALATARYAPTGKNRQDVAWVVLDNREKLDSLIGLVVDAMRGVEGMQRVVQAYEKGNDPILRGAPCAVFAHASAAYDLSPADCAVAVGYLDLTLHSMGLGACWAGYAIRVAQLNPAVRACLGIPEGRSVYGGLMLGYPAVRYQRVPPRLPAKVTWL